MHMRSFWRLHTVCSRYEGEFQEGKKHGVGHYRWKDGATYAGEWKGNKSHGVG